MFGIHKYNSGRLIHDSVLTVYFIEKMTMSNFSHKCAEIIVSTLAHYVNLFYKTSKCQVHYCGLKLTTLLTAMFYNVRFMLLARTRKICYIVIPAQKE